MASCPFALMLFAVVVVLEARVRVGNWETHCHFRLGESVHCLLLLTGLQYHPEIKGENWY
jgi:hypothetical protein